MYRSKSDALDELRYEIGRLGYRFQSAIKLIEEANRLISGTVYSTSCVYITQEDGFHLLTQAGKHEVPQKIPFGNNFPSLCAVRGEHQTFLTPNETLIYMPCYHGHHLLGILAVYSPISYTIDQDDIDFLTEAVKYVKNRLMSLDEI